MGAAGAAPRSDTRDSGCESWLGPTWPTLRAPQALRPPHPFVVPFPRFAGEESDVRQLRRITARICRDRERRGAREDQSPIGVFRLKRLVVRLAEGLSRPR
jgi:hypothetical protein